MGERLRFRIYLSLLFLVMAVGTAGFVLVEDHSVLDAIYFSVVTIATVGYGDIHPVTPAGKMLALFIIIVGVGAFLGAVANATEMMLDNRDRKARMEKLNMVIGLFFSEAGRELLSVFSSCDENMGMLCRELHIDAAWGDSDFTRMTKRIRPGYIQFNIDRIDLLRLKLLLNEKSGLFLRLMENPVLMEHGDFTDMLRAGFHLQEELACRDDLEGQPRSDREHLAGDVNRFYLLLVREWLVYMKYLKNSYPFLFSLAVRLNPFDPDASPVVRE
ncbi:MAG TPA: potassium channel family protein [Spirochaetota bacterium]|nr:potassium channel family protein [Spirochaetota bacterium]